ncbi:hypothetical protein [Paraburkholderia caffeinilytica]|uniref:hypothetical protein n=1 Tax=Paraburkholderia caffeinilytica TaxID=1761016 RepID=UPI003DA014B1
MHSRSRFHAPLKLRFSPMISDRALVVSNSRLDRECVIYNAFTTQSHLGRPQQRERIRNDALMTHP